MIFLIIFINHLSEEVKNNLLKSIYLMFNSKIDFPVIHTIINVFFWLLNVLFVIKFNKEYFNWTAYPNVFMTCLVVLFYYVMLFVLIKWVVTLLLFSNTKLFREKLMNDWERSFSQLRMIFEIVTDTIYLAKDMVYLVFK